MLCVISPAKRLNLKEWDRNAPDLSTPEWTDEVTTLARIAKNLDTSDYERLMHISEKQAATVNDYYDAFSFPHTPDNAKPASLMFSGDTYVGFDAQSLSAADMAYAQNHLVILSGLYGKLRPNDLVRPFRLDMGTKLENSKGKDLYAYWGDKICEAIQHQMKSTQAKALVNLASIEYFKVVRAEKLAEKGLRVITPSFKEIRDNGDIKIMSMFAKRARGSMARWVVENKVTEPEALKDFNVGGYAFQPGASEGDNWTFARPQPPKKTKGKVAQSEPQAARLRKYAEGRDR